MLRKFLIAGLVALFAMLPARAEMNVPGSRGVAGNVANLVKQNQIVQGGATTIDTCASDGSQNVTAGSCNSSFTVNCGYGPNQVWNWNSASPTITAPAISGQCDVWIFVGASASGSLTFSGFGNPASGTGDAIASTNGNVYVVWIGRANGKAIYFVKGWQ